MFMVTLYYIALAAGLITAIVFSALVLLTGKGDAMSGGGSIRTTFKGKANFDDIISRWTLILGISFMGFMILVDVLVKYAKPHS